MISSEIAQASARTQCSRLHRKTGSPKTNPQQLLAPQDGVVLGGGMDQDKNLGNGGLISASISNVRVMLPPGSGREQPMVNSTCGSAEVKAKSSVTKYANPRPIEVNGQMWNVV
ncbi:MAG: hypothetical protein KC800_16535 [Candidatus Eremiobacteraeota bacterium]|nr:hypothetical protein [Candidatus Eremiobacteraeota bacterium]